MGVHLGQGSLLGSTQDVSEIEALRPALQAAGQSSKHSREATSYKTLISPPQSIELTEANDPIEAIVTINTRRTVASPESRHAAIKAAAGVRADSPPAPQARCARP